MSTCPDCTAVKKQAEGNSRYEIIDIGSHVRRLKEFMRLRDTREEFAPMRRLGYVGIPCFILEDGTITFRPRKQDSRLKRRKSHRVRHATLTEVAAETKTS